MQTRRFITALLASIAVFFLWLAIAPHVLPIQSPQTTQPATTEGQGTKEAPSTQPATAEAGAPSTAAAATTEAAPLGVRGAFMSETYTLGAVAADNAFPMRLTLTNRGASLASAALRDFKKTVGSDNPYPLLEPMTPPGDKGEYYSYTTGKLIIENTNQSVELGDVLWNLDRNACSDTQAVFRVDVMADDKPLLDVAKIFVLEPTQVRPAKGTVPVAAMHYDMKIEYTITNQSGEPLDVQVVQRGPVGIHREDPRGDLRRIEVAVNNGESIDLAKHNGKVVRKNVIAGPLDLAHDDETQKVAWVALVNKYFACVLDPVRTGKTPVSIVLDQAITLTNDQDTSFGEDLTYRLVTAPVPVPPGASRTLAFDGYLGPKSKIAFEEVPEYVANNYFELIKADFYVCAPTAVAKLMMWLLQVLYYPAHNYGVAIILLVIIVRLILHPVTKYGQVNMMAMQKKMGKIQPKLDELKKKYGNDKQKFTQAQMELMREAGVNPATNALTGCLPMALQVPIWAGLWAALGSTVEMRHAPFDGYWIKDLAAPDTIYTFSHTYTLPLLGTVTGIHLLPILLAVFMYLQQKLMPKPTPDSTSKQQSDQMAQQQKIMGIMPFFFAFLLYSAPSGLNLYIMASSLGGIIEQWRIRKHVHKLEQKGKFSLPEPGAKKEASKKPGLLTWLEKKAEDAKRIESHRPKR